MKNVLFLRKVYLNVGNHISYKICLQQSYYQMSLYNIFGNILSQMINIVSSNSVLRQFLFIEGQVVSAEELGLK